MSGERPGVFPWRRLGDILVEEFALPAERLDAALAVQAVKGLRLGATLVEMKALGAENLARALARQFDLPYLATLADDQADTELLAELPIGFVKDYLVFPLERQGGRPGPGRAAPGSPASTPQSNFPAAPRWSARSSTRRQPCDCGRSPGPDPPDHG